MRAGESFEVKKRELIHLIREHVAPYFPDLTLCDLTLYAQPIDSILRGICFLPHLRSPENFRVSAIAFPLFVPSGGAGTGWSRQIRRGILDPRDVWSLQDFESAPRRAVLVKRIRANVGILPSLAEPIEVGRKIKYGVFRGNRDWEDFKVGLCYAKAGRISDAMAHIRKILNRKRDRPAPGNLLEDALLIAPLLEAKDTVGIQMLLDGWQARTIEQLKTCGFKPREWE